MCVRGHILLPPLQIIAAVPFLSCSLPNFQNKPPPKTLRSFSCPFFFSAKPKTSRTCLCILLLGFIVGFGDYFFVVLAFLCLPRICQSWQGWCGNIQRSPPLHAAFKEVMTAQKSCENNCNFNLFPIRNCTAICPNEGISFFHASGCHPGSLDIYLSLLRQEPV